MLYVIAFKLWPYLGVLQIKAFRRFDDCFKLATQLGQTDHLTQFDLTFLLMTEDKGSEFIGP